MSGINRCCCNGGGVCLICSIRTATVTLAGFTRCGSNVNASYAGNLDGTYTLPLCARDSGSSLCYFQKGFTGGASYTQLFTPFATTDKLIIYLAVSVSGGIFSLSPRVLLFNGAFGAVPCEANSRTHTTPDECYSWYNDFSTGLSVCADLLAGTFVDTTGGGVCGTNINSAIITTHSDGSGASVTISFST